MYKQMHVKNQKRIGVFFQGQLLSSVEKDLQNEDFTKAKCGDGHVQADACEKTTSMMFKTDILIHKLTLLSMAKIVLILIKTAVLPFCMIFHLKINFLLFCKKK